MLRDAIALRRAIASGSVTGAGRASGSAQADGIGERLVDQLLELDAPTIASIAATSAVSGPMWRARTPRRGQLGQRRACAHRSAPGVAAVFGCPRVSVVPESFARRAGLSPSAGRVGARPLSSVASPAVRLPESFRGPLLLRRPPTRVSPAGFVGSVSLADALGGGRRRGGRRLQLVKSSRPWRS